MNKPDSEILAKVNSFYSSGDFNLIQIGTSLGLSQIHKYLFEEVYEHAGQVRTKNVTIGKFRFASALYLPEILSVIDKLPDSNFDEIVSKFIEMNYAHPFLKGNGLALKVWLNTLLITKLQMVVRWDTVDDTTYLEALDRSTINDLELKTLLKTNLVHWTGNA